MGFISKLLKYCILLAFYIAVFVGLVWLLLGMNPKETYTKARDHFYQVKAKLTGAKTAFSETASDMAGVAKYHLNEAQDRIEGKDPYRNVNFPSN
ncbi:MAG: hypothetical protein LBU87_05575 [Lactobacillales bacterium]|jgi:hypothetical protein|nr:hypothetical protein [Lactobacillales bacterium]